MKRFTVAGIQISIEPNAIEKNLAKSLEWLKKAVKDTKAKFVVFPETVTTGFTPGMSVSEFYNFLPSDITKKFVDIQKLCKDEKMFVVLPSYERGKQKNIIYNTAFLISDTGEIVMKYRKTHLFPTERVSAGGWSTKGNDYPVYKSSIANIGIIICYDGDFPEAARILALKGAEVIVRPSAFLRSSEIWKTTNTARAYDNHTYLVAVNAVGIDAGNNHFFGHSQIVSPIAQVISQATGNEEIIHAELNPDPIKKVSWGVTTPMIFDHLEDRNVESYKDLLLKKAKSPFNPYRRYKN